MSGDKMIEKQKTFLIGVDNICKYFGFGRDFYFECIRLGMPFKKINNRHVVIIKKIDEFIEKIVTTK